MRLNNPYLDFLVLCEQKQALIHQSSAQISPKLLDLFLVLADKHASGQAMTISEAMQLQCIASRAALHKRIDDLREAGMLCVMFKGADRRTKFLVPTDKGDRYLQLMGDLMRAVL